MNNLRTWLIGYKITHTHTYNFFLPEVSIGFIFILQLIDVDGLVMGEKCITLLPKKSHSFRVSFKPKVIGAAYGKVIFIIQGIHLIVSDI